MYEPCCSAHADCRRQVEALEDCLAKFWHNEIGQRTLELITSLEEAAGASKVVPILVTDAEELLTAYRRYDGQLKELGPTSLRYKMLFQLCSNLSLISPVLELLPQLRRCC